MLCLIQRRTIAHHSNRITKAYDLLCICKLFVDKGNGNGSFIVIETWLVWNANESPVINFILS